MLSIDIGHTYGGCVKIEKKQAKLLADLEAKMEGTYMALLCRLTCNVIMSSSSHIDYN